MKVTLVSSDGKSHEINGSPFEVNVTVAAAVAPMGNVFSEICLSCENVLTVIKQQKDTMLKRLQIKQQ